MWFRLFEKSTAIMKPTLLLAMLSMGLSMPGASAATELETLRARCLEQEQQIRILQDQLQELQPSEKPAPKPPVAIPVPLDVVTPETYTVQPGDFLERIARKTHCSAAAIAKANGLKPTTMIHPGQKLKLPETANAPKAPAKPTSTSSLAGKTHKIQEGETYFSIGRKYGVSAESLIAANPNAKATALRPGQVIRLSKEAPTAAPASEFRPVASAAPVPMPPSSQEAPSPSTTPAAATKPPASTPENPSAEVTEIVENPPASDHQADTPPSKPEKKIRSVTIDGEMTYAAFAAKHGTNIDRLNDLNGLDLTNSTVLAKGSELYVPAQP